MAEDSLRRIGGRGFLDNSGDGDLFTIHGIAIGAGDITLGSKSGERKLWTEEVLKEAAATLEGKHIVANHENRDVYSVVGRVTDAAYSDSKNGVVFQGVVDDELLAKRVDRGWLDVSPRIIHMAGESEDGIKTPEEIREFDNLALVTKGAAPSNDVATGESEELSVEELQSCFDNNPENGEVEFEEIELQKDNINYRKHIYEDREGAEGAAEALGCGGSHEVDLGDRTVYMPCQNRDSFIETIKANGSDSDENSEPEKDEEVDENSESEEGEEGEENVENSEFEELAGHMEESELKRMASQLSSVSSLTKMQSKELIRSISPEGPDNMEPVMMLLTEAFGAKEKDVQMAFKNAGLVEEKENSKPDARDDSILNKMFG